MSPRRWEQSTPVAAMNAGRPRSAGQFGQPRGPQPGLFQAGQVGPARQRRHQGRGDVAAGGLGAPGEVARAGEAGTGHQAGLVARKHRHGSGARPPTSTSTPPARAHHVGAPHLGEVGTDQARPRPQADDRGAAQTPGRCWPGVAKRQVGRYFLRCKAFWPVRGAGGPGPARGRPPGRAREPGSWCAACAGSGPTRPRRPPRCNAR